MRFNRTFNPCENCVAACDLPDQEGIGTSLDFKHATNMISKQIDPRDIPGTIGEETDRAMRLTMLPDYLKEQVRGCAELILAGECTRPITGQTFLGQTIRPHIEVSVNNEFL